MVKAGKLLIAHPNLPKRSLFANSVILVTENSSKGVAGLILNKTSGHKADVLLKEHGSLQPNIDVYTGGPVNPGALIMLHSDEWYGSNTMQVPGGLAITSDIVMIKKLADGNSPDFWRLCVGLSGWMPGQLEDEIKEETWLTCDPEPSIIFEYTGRAQWRKALDLCATQAVAHYF